MQSEKYENMLNMALETPSGEREKTQDLEVGYNVEEGSWDLIVKYNGDLLTVLKNLDERIEASLLLGGYAILTVPEERMEQLSSLTEIEYVEKPKRLYFAVDRGRVASCVNEAQAAPLRLSGQGTCFAMVDSGIDYTHPDFRNEDGTTRILAIWDQTVNGTPPEGYVIGTEYTKEQIDEALRTNMPLGTVDTSGHGTAVAGVAVSNGRSSGGRYRGVAPQAQILVVKLGVPRTESFPRTTELMLAVDYVIKKAQQAGLPVAINISFGNNYGSHDGTSLLETFLDTASDVWKNVICVGAGNEGVAAGHVDGMLQNGDTRRIEFVISPYETTMNLQIWKQYADDISVAVITPSGTRIQLYQENQTQRFQIGDTTLLVYYGRPKPYSINQEIYIEFIPEQLYINDGVWIIELQGENIRQGMYHIWLPSTESLNAATAFLNPSAYRTLTIPSTARKVITVGAYDSNRYSYADFSGRGYRLAQPNNQKPDIAAPGVDITTTAAGGGYASFTGTSFATPFVTGAACLLMEYGIVEQQDIYIYGETIKAFLQKGAKTLEGFPMWPNAQLGWGTLCVADSLP